MKPDFPAGPVPQPVDRAARLDAALFPAPGRSGLRGGPRASRVSVPALPALPVSESVAADLLGRVEGAAAPEDWTGWLDGSLPPGSDEGDGSAPHALAHRVARAPQRHRDSSRGAVATPASVVVGAHTDAWVNGAVDPVSGVAVVLETAAALSALAREGWKPERDVVFALFDGEEYGMLGSTRWVEERLAARARPTRWRRLPLRRLVGACARLHGRRLAGPRRSRSTRSSGTSSIRFRSTSSCRCARRPAPRLQRRHVALPRASAACRPRSSGSGGARTAIPLRIRRSVSARPDPRSRVSS